MPTTPVKCRKLLKGGVAQKRWSKEGVFYIQMLVPTGEETQDMALAIDPGSKYDGYTVAGITEVALQGMSVLPRIVHRRMETRRVIRHNRRRRKCRRREVRVSNRKGKDGWITPSQLVKVQLRNRLMERLCRLFPITDIVIEDVRFNHYKKRWGKDFSTVEIGKAKVYERANRLATLWLPRGWETAEMRSVYDIKKSSQKDKLSPESHANDAWAMCCWLYGTRPENDIGVFYVWRRQGCSKRQLHLQNFSVGGTRGRYGGTTYLGSNFRKGDVVRHRNGAVGYVGGWTQGGKMVNLVGADGKRIQYVGRGSLEILSRAPNILTERI